MKRTIPLIVAASTFLALAACGTESQSSPQDAPTSEKKPAEKTEAPKDNASTSDENNKVRLPEKKLTYEMEGMKEQKTAFLKTSKNQNYTLYVIDGYDLTEEEPRKDIITYNENDKLWMRVEVLEKGQDLSDVKANSLETLKAGYGNAKEVMDFSNDKNDIDSVFTGESKTEKGAVYLVKETEDHPALRLTMFAPLETESFEPFLEMARTIQIQ